MLNISFCFPLKKTGLSQSWLPWCQVNSLSFICFACVSGSGPCSSVIKTCVFGSEAKTSSLDDALLAPWNEGDSGSSVKQVIRLFFCATGLQVGLLPENTDIECIKLMRCNPYNSIIWWFFFFLCSIGEDCFNVCVIPLTFKKKMFHSCLCKGRWWWETLGQADNFSVYDQAHPHPDLQILGLAEGENCFTTHLIFYCKQN